MASPSLLDSRAGLLDTFLPAFVLELVQGDLTPGEKELAYNLTVIYGLSLLSMVVCYRLLRPLLSPPAQDSPAALQPSLASTLQPCLPSLASTLALVKARRSVTPKDLNGSPLAREEVEAVLEAANWAPTHHRNEPWRFTLLQGPQAIAGYLDRLDQWYSEHREEMGQEEYTSSWPSCRAPGPAGCTRRATWWCWAWSARPRPTGPPSGRRSPPWAAPSRTCTWP